MHNSDYFNAVFLVGKVDSSFDRIKSVNYICDKNIENSTDISLWKLTLN
jgi:hypothetical protein